MSTTTLAVVGYGFLGLLGCAALFLVMVAASAAADSRRRRRAQAARPRPPVVIRRPSIVIARKVCVLRPITPGAALGLMLGDEDGSVLVRFDTCERALGVAVALEAEAREQLGLLREQAMPPAEGAPGWAPLRSVRPDEGPGG